MRRSVIVVFLLTLAVPRLALAQAQAAGPPAPGPEVQRLGFWVGTWHYESANATGTLTYEWMTGGFSVIGREEGTDRVGEGRPPPGLHVGSRRAPVHASTP